jgi:hypothetical protein
MRSRRLYSFAVSIATSVVLLAGCGRGDADSEAAYQQQADKREEATLAAVGEGKNKACAVFSPGELSKVLGVRVNQPVSTWPSCTWLTAGANPLVFATVIDDPEYGSDSGGAGSGCKEMGWQPLEGIASIACGGPSQTNPQEFMADAWMPSGYVRVATPTREHTIQLLRLAVQRFPDL